MLHLFSLSPTSGYIGRKEEIGNQFSRTDGRNVGVSTALVAGDRNKVLRGDIHRS